MAQEKNGFEYKLREEFRFSNDSSINSNIVFFAPGIRYNFNDVAKVSGEYWIFLNQKQHRFNLDLDADFGNFASRIRFQSGWEEFVDHNEVVRFRFRFQQDDNTRGFFNPAVDFEIFHEFGTLIILDRYRGGLSNRFKIGENMTCKIGVSSQQFTGNNSRRDYLYQFRITYKV
ncbi:MAG: DUF2490 domain-containing protein [bacterium]|nr:DUF2490 domain-containing protein [bacterium]